MWQRGWGRAQLVFRSGAAVPLSRNAADVRLTRTCSATECRMGTSKTAVARTAVLQIE